MTERGVDGPAGSTSTRVHALVHFAGGGGGGGGGSAGTAALVQLESSKPTAVQSTIRFASHFSPKYMLFFSVELLPTFQSPPGLVQCVIVVLSLYVSSSCAIKRGSPVASPSCRLRYPQNLSGSGFHHPLPSSAASTCFPGFCRSEVTS